MHLPSPLAVWRTVALASLTALGAACGALWWNEPQATTEEETVNLPRSAERREPGSAQSSHLSKLRVSGRVAQLSAAIDQARSPDARCTALMQLGRNRDIGDAEVAQIAHYAAPSHREDTRSCAITALGSTQLPSVLP